MTFIECFPREPETVVVDVLRQTYSSAFGLPSPAIELRELIEWRGRLFREFRLQLARERLLHEEALFLRVPSQWDRATVQLGYLDGDGGVFCAPPLAGHEITARLIDKGVQTTVSPFAYESRA